MNATDGQRVLRCPQCQKPFDRASTLKRHGYYCLSRRQAAASRLRSCVSCAKGKARCDHGRPQCSRCTSKGIECHYPARSLGRASTQACQGQQRHLNPGASRGQPPAATALGGAEAPHVAGSHDDVGASLLAQFPLSESSAHEQLEWDDGFDFSQTFDQQGFEMAGEYTLSASSTMGSQPSFWTSRSSAILESNVSPPVLPAYLSSPEPRRTLTHRHKAGGTGAYRTAHVLFQGLRAYPIMMVNHSSLPPIIHPSIISLNADNEDMEPLNNCASLLHILSRGTQGCQKLFWANVRRECADFRATSRDMNKWKLLAVQQALFIYVIVRLDQGETEHNNLDVLMRTTVTEVSTRMKTVYKEHRTRPSRVAENWREWIFLESLRRLCSIYQILNSLVCFDPAALCNLQPGISIAPLPTEKRLWEASDAVTWQREYERKVGLPVEFGLATNGELVKMGRNEVQVDVGDSHGRGLGKGVLSRSPTDLAEWCSEMDGLGGLIMVAASAIE